MGRKSKIYIILNEFIQRKDDKNTEILTKSIISNLQINKDPLLQLFGDVIQSINEYWYIKFEKFNNKSLKEWEGENDERIKEIDKRKIYQDAAEALSIYMPFYKSYKQILNRNKNMIIDDVKKEYISMHDKNSFLEVKRRSDLSLVEIKLLEKHKLKKFKRVPAFIILCHRFKNDKDFPIKIDLNNIDSIMDQFDKFIKQFYKSPYSKNQNKQSE